MAQLLKQVLVITVVALLVAALFNGVFWLFHTYLRDKV